MALSWRYISTQYVSPGSSYEPDGVLPPGTAIAFHNEEYQTGQVQEWGVASVIGDLGAGLPYNTRVVSILCYSKAQVVFVPNIPEDSFSAQLYVPQKVKDPYVQVSYYVYQDFDAT